MMNAGMPVIAQQGPFTSLLFIGLFTLLCCYSSNTYSIDWDQVENQQIVLFYPGKGAWNKLLTRSTHRGATKIRRGKSCHNCHAEEEVELGAVLAEWGGAETEMATGETRTSLIVDIKAAVHSDSFYLRLSLPTAAEAIKQLSLILGEDAYQSPAQVGCCAACHDGLKVGSGAIKSPLTTLLSRAGSSNTPAEGERDNNHETVKTQLKQGQFIELWSISTDGVGRRGYIHERHYYLQTLLPQVRVEATEDRQVIEISRPLRALNAGEVSLREGVTYYFGLVLHESGTEGHKHFVSLGHALGIGGKGPGINVRAVEF